MDNVYLTLIIVYGIGLIWYYIAYRKYIFLQKLKNIKRKILIAFTIFKINVPAVNDIVDRELANLSVGCLESIDDWWKNPARFATLPVQQFEMLNRCGYIKTLTVLGSMMAWSKLVNAPSYEKLVNFISNIKARDWATQESFLQYPDILLRSMGIYKTEGLDLSEVFIPL
jgi:hypothetical protein